MPAILVSGGTGLVGRFVVEDMLAAGHQVTILGRTEPPDGYFSRSVSFVRSALEPDRINPRPFEGIDAFVHAAFDHVPGRYRGGEGGDPERFVRRNLLGSQSLFAAARAAGVARAVLMSSRAVYGTQATGARLGEELEPHPDTLYGRVKLDLETALLGMTGASFVSTVLRVTGVYGAPGPGRVDKWQDLIVDYLAGRPVTPRAGSEVHGGDVAAAVRRVVEARAGQVSGEIFNVSDIIVDRRDLLAPFRRATGCSHPLPQPDTRPLQVMKTGKLRRLGWQPGGRALFDQLLEERVQALVRQSCGGSAGKRVVSGKAGAIRPG